LKGSDVTQEAKEETAKKGGVQKMHPIFGVVESHVTKTEAEEFTKKTNQF